MRMHIDNNRKGTSTGDKYRANVKFDAEGNILTAKNVKQVVKNAPGEYTVHFDKPLRQSWLKRAWPYIWKAAAFVAFILFWTVER